MKDLWNSEIYSQFLDLRTRPARDLLSAIPDLFQPKIIYDLGCGPGNSTGLLKNRWPHAKIVGVDSSEDMLKEAKIIYPDIEFIKSDIKNFDPIEENKKKQKKEKIDCLFANASLQWLDNHEVLIPRLLQLMNAGGIFAIQMPNNFHSPSHQVTIRILQESPTWRPLLKNLRYGNLVEPFYNPLWYYDLFSKNHTNSIQIWETVYFQEMSDYQKIFNWVKGTGLRPVLTAMDAANQAQFENAYIKQIEKEYPREKNNKILLPFRRIFMTGIFTP